MIILRFLVVAILYLCLTQWVDASREHHSVYFNPISRTDSLPPKNKAVLAYVIKQGRKISPTYQSSVCTELLIGVLKHFTVLSKEEKNRIRIITEENVHQLRLANSPVPKGVYYALTQSNKGVAIDRLQDVKAGDFVQFWYWSWGHCGIVKSIDTEHKTMELYSSYPTTNGYGIQTFNIPPECYFVRLK